MLSVSTTPTNDSDNNKHNIKPIPVCEHYKNNIIPRNSVGSYMVVSQKVRSALPMTNRTQGEYT